MRHTCLFLVCLILLSGALAAQTAVPESAYRQADTALAAVTPEPLGSFLDASSKTAWYPRLEAYILKRARQMVIENRLEKARDVSLAVIDRNLDNTEAVDLYQSIQAAILRRDAEAKKAAEQKALDAFRQQATQERIREDLTRTYKTVTNTTSGKKVYLDQDFNEHYRSWTWALALGLANVGYITDPAGPELKYGLSVDGALFYHGEDFSAGADIGGRTMLLALSGAQTLSWTGSAVFSYARNSVSKYLVLRGGAMADGYGFGSTDADGEAALFASPVAGLGVRDVRLGSSGRFEAALDYYPGHLLRDDMTAAFGAKVSLAFVMADMQDFDIHFHTGLRDTCLMYSSGIRNDAQLFWAIGVGNYE